jgi:alcohol dehydrogenase (cytochrome c)
VTACRAASTQIPQSFRSRYLQTYKIGQSSRRAQGKLLGCPDIQGGVNYFPTTCSHKTHMSYGGGIEVCSFITPDPSNDDNSAFWLGGTYERSEAVKGSVTAMDPTTGKKVAQKSLNYAVYSGVVSTAGGLVFTTTSDGTVYALDDKTLEVLWSFNTGSLSSAPPMTYSVNGKQYVAVLIGGNTVAQGMLAKSPELKDMQNTSMLFVFGL